MKKRKRGEEDSPGEQQQQQWQQPQDGHVTKGGHVTEEGHATKEGHVTKAAVKLLPAGQRGEVVVSGVGLAAAYYRSTHLPNMSLDCRN